MKVKKITLSVLAVLFLISLIVCGRDCMRYEKAVKDTANAEESYERLRQQDAERMSNDWNYAMNLGSGYVEQRRASDEMINRAQEKIWEQEDRKETLANHVLCSAGLTVVLFVLMCVFYMKAVPKNTIQENKKQ